MLQSKLRNRYNKNRTEENERAFKKQRNWCVKLLRKTKCNYYQNLDLKNLSDNRKFWRTVKPIFSGKVQTSSSVTLAEGSQFISNDKAITEIFNEYFVNITGSIDVGRAELNLLSTDGIKDPIDVAITKYSLHPSVKRIKNNFNPSRMFEFALVSKEEVYKQLDKLDLKKATPLESIPAKILKGSSDVFLPYLTNTFNLCLAENYFPNELKKGMSPRFTKRTMP